MGIMYEINDEVIDQIQEMAGRIRQDIVKMLGEAGSAIPVVRFRRPIS